MEKRAQPSYAMLGFKVMPMALRFARATRDIFPANGPPKAECHNWSFLNFSRNCFFELWTLHVSSSPKTGGIPKTGISRLTTTPCTLWRGGCGGHLITGLQLEGFDLKLVVHPFAKRCDDRPMGASQTPSQNPPNSSMAFS
jgi:hypothetical protein